MTSGLRRIESSCDAADGLRLHFRTWQPGAPDLEPGSGGAPERVVLLVHGYAEHSGRYEEIARWLAARGCVVHAYDHRGHGRSAGRRVHVERFEQYVDDLARVQEQLAQRHQGLPLHLVGHSMGGLVTAAFLQRGAPQVASAVLSGPALSAEGASALRMLGARVLRRLAPTFALGSGIDAAGLSRDAAVVQAYLDDPLITGHMTVSLACELLGAIPQVQERAAEVRTKLLVLHGEADPICPPAGSVSFVERVPGASVKLYPQLRHEIFNELGRESVYRDVLDWLREAGGQPRPPREGG